MSKYIVQQITKHDNCKHAGFLNPKTSVNYQWLPKGGVIITWSMKN